MTALTRDRNTAARAGDAFSAPVAAAARIYNGALVALDASGDAVPGSTALGLVAAGRAEARVDNSGGLAGDLSIDIRRGVFRWTNSAGGDGGDGGGGAEWYLMVTKLPVKPLIYQHRKKFQFVAKNKPDDDNVFHEGRFMYGVDGRANVGFGFWQFIYGSRQSLNADNYAAAKVAMSELFKDIEGEPLGIMPDLLLVPTTLQAAGKQVIEAQLVNGGESNIWHHDVELKVSAWL